MGQVHNDMLQRTATHCLIATYYNILYQVDVKEWAKYMRADL